MWFALIPVLGRAATGDVVVVVTDAVDHHPLAGVRVVIAGETLLRGRSEVRSGPDGRATFPAVPTGDYRVAAYAWDRFAAGGTAQLRTSSATVAIPMRAAPASGDPTWANQPAPRWDVARLLDDPTVASLGAVQAELSDRTEPFYVVAAKVGPDEITLRTAMVLTPPSPVLVLDAAPSTGCSEVLAVTVDGRPTTSRTDGDALLVTIPTRSVGRVAVVVVDQRRCVEPLCADARALGFEGTPSLSVSPEQVVMLGRWLPLLLRPSPGSRADFLVAFDVAPDTTVVSTGSAIGRQLVDPEVARITIAARDTAGFAAALGEALWVEDHLVDGRPVRIAWPVAHPGDAGLIRSRLEGSRLPLPPLVVTGRSCGPPAVSWPGLLDTATGASVEAMGRALAGTPPPATDRERRELACGNAVIPEARAFPYESALTAALTPFCLEYLASSDQARSPYARGLLESRDARTDGVVPSTFQEVLEEGSRRTIATVEAHRDLPDARRRIRDARVDLMNHYMFAGGLGVDGTEAIRMCIASGLCDAQGTMWFVEEAVFDGSSGRWDIPGH